MADIAGILGGSLKDKVLGVAKTQKVVKENPNTLLKIVGKNFMSLPGFARDLNVARQNIQRLVKLEGGKPSTGADAYFLKSSEREKKLETEMAAKKPSPTAGEVLKKNLIRIGLFKLLQIVFTSFIKVVQKYFTPLIILGAIFVGFKDAFAEWASGLWEAIKTSFGEFVEGFKKWFEESVQPIIDKVKDFIKPIIDAISGFFGKIGDFFVGYFNVWKDLITAPIQTIKNLYDGFMNKVNGLIDILPDFVKKKLGISVKGEKPVDDSAEKAKLERQQKEALETERVKKLEKEKQYTGDDEIVRKRLDIPEKTETMKREAKAKKAGPIEVAPSPDSLIVPGPAPAAPAAPPPPTTPSAAAPKPTPKAEAPSAPSPAPSLPQEGPVAIVVKALEEQGITNNFTKIAVLANIRKEVGKDMQPKSENLAAYAKTSNARIREVFTTRVAKYSDAELDEIKKDTVRFGEVIYGKDTKIGQGMGNTKEGDGYKYRGRGYIQFTGKNNYDSLGKAIKEDLVSNPDKVNDPFIAAKMTAAYVIRGLKNKINEFTSQSEANRAVTQAVGGAGLNLNEGIGAKILAKVEAESSSFSGSNIGSSSTQVASGQRQQQKPQTPVVVNAPTNNTTVVNNTQVAASKRQDTGNSLATARA